MKEYKYIGAATIKFCKNGKINKLKTGDQITLATDQYLGVNFVLIEKPVIKEEKKKEEITEEKKEKKVYKRRVK